MFINHVPLKTATIPLPEGEVFDVEYSQPFFRQDSCRLRSFPWLMCAVYRRAVHKLRFVIARSRAISMSCLCRNSSNIRIRIADEIPLILSVATLYIYIYVYVICGVVNAFIESRCLWCCVTHSALCPQTVLRQVSLSLFAICCYV